MEKSQDTLFGKTSQEHSTRLKVRTSERSSKVLQESNTPKCLYLNVRNGREADLS